MKMWISQYAVGVAVVLSGALTSVPAHDLVVPCWRGQTGTTFQEWRFDTDANPAVPEVSSNPYGTAQANISLGEYAVGWIAGPLAGFGTQTGLWDMGFGPPYQGPGIMALNVPNRPGSSSSSYALIAVQITEFVDNSYYYPATVSIPNATLVDSKISLVEKMPVPLTGGWYSYQTTWRLAPSPAEETITITANDLGGIIDQVVIDTRCVDGISPAGTPAVGTQSECDGYPVMFYGGGTYTFDLANATGTAGAGWDLLTSGGTGTIDVQSTSGNPFTIVLKTPAGGAANFSGATDYDWVIATTGGGVLNFDASKFAVDVSGFGTANGVGTFSLQTANGGKDLVLHHQHTEAPLAGAATYSRGWGTSWKMLISSLLTNATAYGGHAVSLVSVGTATLGTASSDATRVYYLPPNPDMNETASFTYTIKDDVNNQTGSGTVTIVSLARVGQAQSISVVAGQVTVVFAGVPGRLYDIQRSATADFASFETLQTTAAPPLGTFTFVDSNPLTGMGYYRLRTAQ